MKTVPTFDEIRAILKDLSIGQKELQAGHKQFQIDMQALRDSQKETDRQLKKTDRQMQETDRQMQETDRQIRGLQKKTDRQMQETDRRIMELQKETDRRIMELQKKTDRQMQETDRRIKEMVGDFGNRWGKLGENLVKGNLAQRLSERGIKVDKVITNVKNKHSEFDIIAINGRESVVVEVKATLDPSDVDEFQEDMRHFKEWWPEFKRKRVYGAMAFLMRANRLADSMARKRGFFVIEAVGDVVIQNRKNFKPRVFS